MSDAEVLAAYRATSWTVDGPSGPLLVRPGERVPPGSLQLPAAVVTAFNPGSVSRTNAENRRANQSLAAEIRRCGAGHSAALAHGNGPLAERWDEPGFLVSGLDLHDAVSLAARFDQNAILWIGDDAVPVLVCVRPGFAGCVPGSVL